jgi:soluble lytic murein transglycosylase-like protein
MRARFALIGLLVLAPLVGLVSRAEPAAAAPVGLYEGKIYGAGPPGPDAAIPLEAAALAQRLRATRQSLQDAIDRWRTDVDPREGTPRDVTLYALHEQRIYVLLTARRHLAREVVDRLHDPIAAEARAILAAKRELGALATPAPRRRFRTGPAKPAGVLLRYYRKAERRFGVSWKVLAAVNFVESAFGRMRNKSSAGAQGPMQFIPSTWDAYGMGGDIDDPHDAIMGAANYLHASGAPEDNRRALYAYNPSRAYVDAVMSYTRRIRRDRHRYFAFHSWQVFVHTPSGIVRITGPGLDR